MKPKKITRSVKESLFSEVALKLSKALLSKENLTKSAFAKNSGITQPHTRTLITKLAENGIITTEGDGKNIEIITTEKGAVIASALETIGRLLTDDKRREAIK